MKWRETEIDTIHGRRKAAAPEIISASRSTDIPAFYSEWFINRLRCGYAKWVNPFNHKPQYVSFENAKAIVFWSKNPRPLFRFLDEIAERCPAFYFQFTLNDYEAESLEPGVPPLDERIKTFRELSAAIGRERVIWRFDPLIITDELNVEKLVKKIEIVGDRVAAFTEKLVFSFSDISGYRKVQNNLRRAGVKYAEFTSGTMLAVSERIAQLCSRWGIEAATCAESVDLSAFGISHNKCIDDALILRILKRKGKSTAALSFSKDTGQRAACRCVASKDIGQYNTCPHMCVYCYANSSERAVRKNTALSDSCGESISGE